MDKTFTFNSFCNFVRMFRKITLIKLPPQKIIIMIIIMIKQQKRFVFIDFNIFKETNSCVIYLYFIYKM